MPQTEKDKEVEDMKEFMSILTDVKVTLARQTEKLENVLDMKEKVDTAHDTSREANRRSIQNEESIKLAEKNMGNKLENKADKDDVERIVKEKDNWKRNLPAWVAVAISAIAILIPYFN